MSHDGWGQPLSDSQHDEFSIALSGAIRDKGVTLEWLRRRLVERGNPVSSATLSYWRSGRSQPEHLASLDAVADVEVLLGLPRGALLSRLGPSRRPGPAIRRADVADVVDHQAAIVESALRDLGLSGPPRVAEETLHVVVRVDAERRVASVSVRMLLRALVDGWVRLPLIYVLPAPATLPDITVLGGRTGLDRSRPEIGLIAREVVIDQPMLAGERSVAEQTTVFGEGIRDTHYEHFAVNKLKELVIWVHFDPSCMPTRIEAVDTVDGSTSVIDLGAPTTSAHLIRRQFGPGRADIRWHW